jgi:hypothetical protein
MNRKLIVTLLKKDIQELAMITEGFMEMDEYPKAIILLAEHKIEDIQSYINQLSEIKPEETNIEFNIKDSSEVLPLQSQLNQENEEQITASEIDTETSDEIHDEIDAALELTSELVEVDTRTNGLNEINESDLVSDIDSEKTENEKLFREESRQISVNELGNQINDTIISDKVIVPVSSSTNEIPSGNETADRPTLANTKINDIKQAIGIGDRFRFQRELFRGNGEDMNKTLTYLNLLATLEEALSFLKSKYGWTSDNETAEDFYQIVRRLFL